MFAFGLISFGGVLLAANANLEGPFVFWGPNDLSPFRRPALERLEQDDLIDIYDDQAAVVVFDIQDRNFFLTRESHPRLRKLLETKSYLFLPQDFLDVHPEYINNETQIVAVQGPNSEQDAEITEKFERLEDVYGKGNVLAVLGSSGPEEEVADDDLDDYSNKNYVRERREATPEPKEAPVEYIYTDLERRVLLYTADYPILRFLDKEYNNTPNYSYKLKKPVSVTIDERPEYSRMIIVFSNVPSGKITLRFKFPNDKSGYWNMGPVEYFDHRGKELLLYLQNKDVHIGAPKRFSFACSNEMVFSNDTVSLTLNEIQVQPFLKDAKKFGPSYNCVGFTTIPIWSGLLVTFILLFGLTVALIMISEIKTMDRFENIKGKTLTFTVID